MARSGQAHTTEEGKVIDGADPVGRDVARVAVRSTTVRSEIKGRIPNGPAGRRRRDEPANASGTGTGLAQEASKFCMS